MGEKDKSVLGTGDRWTELLDEDSWLRHNARFNRVNICLISSNNLVPPTPVSWVPVLPVEPDLEQLPPAEPRPTPPPWWPTASPTPQNPSKPIVAPGSEGGFFRPDLLPPDGSQPPGPIPSPHPPNSPFHRLSGLIPITHQPPPLAPGAGHNVVVETATIPPPVREKAGGREDSPLTVRQLYERALKALCRWLPRILKNVSYQGCMIGGQRAIKWVISMHNKRILINDALSHISKVIIYYNNNEK